MEMEDKIAAHRTRAREAAASEAAARAALEAETERASKETSEANKRCEEGEFLYFNACTCTGNCTDVVFFYHNSRTNRRARNETRERRDAPSRTRRRRHRSRHERTDVTDRGARGAVRGSNQVRGGTTHASFGTFLFVLSLFAHMNVVFFRMESSGSPASPPTLTRRSWTPEPKPNDSASPSPPPPPNTHGSGKQTGRSTG